MYRKSGFSGERRTSKEMYGKLQLFKIAIIRKTKPRIADAGLYPLNNRLGKGLHSWLASCPSWISPQG